MPVLTINGRQVTVDDSFINLSREEQDATVEEIAGQMPKQGPSGVMAGFGHGVQDTLRGDTQTAKSFYGAGKVYAPNDDDFVPANVTNGSFNPMNWNLSQIPQKIAEQAPGLGQDIVAASAASKIAPGGIKGKALAGLIGGALSAWHRTAGDTAKETAVNRTGDANAEPETRDLAQGGLTAAAASAVGALTPSRFIPGANKIGTVGAQGAGDALKKYVGTALTGAGASGVADAVTQGGTQLGTDKSFDPARTLESAVGGGLAAGTLAAPRGIADTARATSLREFGGSNMEATKNYATRLKTAGDGDLGNTIGGAKNDYLAHETVKTDLKNEMRDAAKSVRDTLPGLHPDADNALQRAQNGEHLTPRDIDLIDSATAAAPDGANASYLARTLRVAQLAQGRGSYNTRGEWAGGVSGLMDKNLGFMLNPVRLAGGTIATGLGMHLLGMSNPLFAGSVGSAYLGARALDGMTGYRSPAKMFADHFADRQAQLRIPTTPQAPAAPAAPTAPWGPRPSPTTSVPPVAPQAAPPMTPPPMPWGPKPLAQQSVPQVAQPAPPAPKPLSPTEMNEQVKSALLMASARRKVEGQKAAEAMAADSPVVQANGGAELLSNPAFGKTASAILSAAKAHEGMLRDPAEEARAASDAQAVKEQAAADKAKARADAQEKTQAERAQAKAERAQIVATAAKAKAEQAKTREEAKAQQLKAKEDNAAAKEAARVAAAHVKAANAQLKATGKITKSKGKVESTAVPETPFEPLPEEHLYPHGISAKDYAEREAASYGTQSPRYKLKAEQTATKRIDASNEFVAKYPQFSHAVTGKFGLLRQLHRIGPNPVETKQAVEHFAGLLPDTHAAHALREAFQ